MKLRIGTRGSDLALFQANCMRNRILEKFPEFVVEIIPIKTTGDKIINIPLSNIGGKGLFIKELEEHLLSNKIDIAVHSLKDVPAILPKGLAVRGFLEREDAREVLISKYYSSIDTLPDGATIATSSPRRAAQILAKNASIKILSIRGNIGSRVNKVLNQSDDGSTKIDATILAIAGLKRLDAYNADYCNIIELDEMVPSVGQGVICGECRETDSHISNVLESITHQKTKTLVLAERGFVETIQGNCKTPVGAHAYYIGKAQNNGKEAQETKEPSKLSCDIDHITESDSVLAMKCFLSREDFEHNIRETFFCKDINFAYDFGQKSALYLIHNLHA